MPPAAPLRFAIAAGGNVRRLLFDVVHVERRPADIGPQAMVHDEIRFQPDARVLFGVDLPLELTGAAADGARDLLRVACDSWWRGTLPRLRANLLLAQWLLALIEERCAPAPLPAAGPGHGHNAWLFRAEQEVRNRLGRGAGPLDMARAAGLSYRQFHRSYRQARGITPLSAESEYIAQTHVQLPEDRATEVLKLVDLLEQDEDVQKVFHNLG